MSIRQLFNKVKQRMSEYLKELFGLEGKTAVVIGGTGVLCGTMAEGLAHAGAELVVVGRNAEKAKGVLERLEPFRGRGYFERADVSQEREIENLLERVLERSNGVDILVNGAGINSPTPFFEITREEFDGIVDTNLRSVFLASQIFGRHMVDRGKGGSIINMGSMSGLVPISRVFTYSITKAAVHNLSKNLAREWAQTGVRVNTLVPGFFPAEQNRKILTPDRIESIMRHTPMDRFGEADELIGATLFLASEKAAGFVTGAEIVVDGGFSSMAV